MELVKKKRFYSVILKINRERVLLILLISLVMGICVGVIQIISQSKDASDKLMPYLVSFIEVILKGNFCKILFTEILFVLPCILLSVFMGFSAIGTPVTAALPFIFGTGCGCTVSYIYSMFAFKGISYIFLTTALPFAAYGFLLILSCKESSRLSQLIMKTIRNKVTDEIDYKKEIQISLLRQLFFTAFLLLTALAKSLLVISFRRILM